MTPRWTQPFVQEPKEIPDDLASKEKPSARKLTWALFAVSVVGLGLQVLTVVYPTFRLLMIYPAASWAVACVLIAIRRLVTTPKSLLVLYCTIAASQLVILIDGTRRYSGNNVPVILAILAAFVAIGIILVMPMRHPSRPSTEISTPFSTPTSSLRSPEDNMTLFQFMTVSWMKPLIEMGNKRQLNDEDVWDLGYEFKHRMLHDGFRELKGSVLRRLLEANGIDLLIMSLLAFIELVASMFFLF